MTPPRILCRDTDRLAALHRYGILDTPAERDFDELRDLAAQICGTPIAVISFVDADRQWFKSEFGLGVQETPLESSICAHALLESELLIVPDTLRDERFRYDSICLGEKGLRFYAGAVIRAPDGHPLGTLCVLDYKPRVLDPEEISGLLKLARQVTRLLELRWQKSEAERIAALRGEISVSLASNEPVPQALQTCVEGVVEHLRVAFARVWTLEADQTLHLRASAGLYTHLDGAHGRIRIGEYKIGRIALSGEPLLTNDVLHDSNISDPEWARQHGMRAFAGYPLAVAGRVVGVLGMFSRSILSEAVLHELAPIADGVAQYLERKTAEAALRAREETARFLGQVSIDLAELTDYHSALQIVSSATVPMLADACCVDLAEGEGALRRLCASHLDPEMEGLILELARRYPCSLEGASCQAAVLRSGQPLLVAQLTEEFWEREAMEAEHLRLQLALGWRSLICVPLVSRGKTVGLITLATVGEEFRQFTDADLQTAMEVARRASVAIENATLLHALQEADRRKDEFLATLAHELRNPLAPLRNAVALLGSPDESEAARREMRGVMERQLQQMMRLVDDLLDASRITRGHIELRRELVSLSDVIESAAEISRPLIGKAGQVLTMQLPSFPVMLHADPTRLAQIFSNLLNNASKYTDPGGSIWLTATLEEGEAVVQVRDNGVGIAREMLERVFELFTQEDRSLERSQGGLGIGLTLVRKLVEMHSGKVVALSDGLGCGSVFTVRLPARLDSIPPGLASTSARPTPTAPRRILVVDDNRDAATTLARLLRRRGHEVELAYDGEEAVTAALTFLPDAVLLDIGLPKLNGYEAARRILEQAAGRPVMLVALTGWSQDDDRHRAAEAGFAHHLVKPVDFEAVIELLSRAASLR